MKFLLDRRPPGSRLYLLAALAATFLLVPTALASAFPVHIEFEGSGSGWVKGDEITPTPGEPPIECHWNGTEIDVGTSPGEGSGVPDLNECTSETQEISGLQGIAVKQETDTGSEWGGWTLVEGEKLVCGTGNNCSAYSLGEDIIIKATFEADVVPEVPLIVEVEGEGEVTGPGITCTEAENGEAACEEEFTEGSEPELTATPEAGWEFAGWTPEEGQAGSCEGTTSPCEAGPLTSQTKLKATFVQEPNVHIVIEGGGSGSVLGTGTLTGEPPVECEYTSPGPQTGACDVMASDKALDGVTVIHEADPGSVFAGWTPVKGFEGESSCKPPLKAQCTLLVGFGATEIEIKALFEVAVPLTLETTGTGTGSFECKVEINGEENVLDEEDCNELSSNEMAEGWEVEVIAVPDGGSEFTGFSGDCTGEGTCVVTMDEARTVIANFDLEGPVEPNTLTVNKAGDGDGRITSDPWGINCGSLCENEFEGVVTLEAAVPAGNTFVGWTGCDSTPKLRECVVDLSSSDREVIAEYAATSTLTVEKAGSGDGRVTSNPWGINCGSFCSHAYVTETTVTLTAAVPAGNAFVGWTGCDATPSPRTCEVSVEGSTTVTAEYAQTHLLKVEKAGDGDGRVTSSPWGINCGSFCEREFEAGTTVTLTAAVPAGNAFVGWTGCDENPKPRVCVVEMDEPKTPVATYEETP